MPKSKTRKGRRRYRPGDPPRPVAAKARKDAANSYIKTAARHANGKVGNPVALKKGVHIGIETGYHITDGKVIRDA